MSSSIPQLSTDELWHVLDEVDLLDLLSTGLVGGQDGSHSARLAPWGEDSDGELAVLEDLRTGARCLLPTAGLRMLRAATLTALAARHLLPPGVVTAAVLGSTKVAQLQLTVIASYLPDISHVALLADPGRDWSPIAPRVLDQLDLAGIGLSVTPEIDEVTLGANLVIAIGPGAARLRPDRLATGALLVNASGRDLPDPVVAAADQIFVDDLRLLAASADRNFVTPHRPEPKSRRGRDRRPTREVAADLPRVVDGSHPGRAHRDETVLVELLSTGTVDVELAYELGWAALKRGFGAEVWE